MAIIIKGCSVDIFSSNLSVHIIGIPIRKIILLSNVNCKLNGI